MLGRIQAHVSQTNDSVIVHRPGLSFSTLNTRKVKAVYLDSHQKSLAFVFTRYCYCYSLMCTTCLKYNGTNRFKRMPDIYFDRAYDEESLIFVFRLKYQVQIFKNMLQHQCLLS